MKKSFTTRELTIYLIFIYSVAGAFSSFTNQYFKELYQSFDTAKLGRFLLYRMKKNVF